MSIYAMLHLTVQPESVAAAPAVIHETLTATRAFDGCLGVEVLLDADDQTHIVLVERWASVESDAAYRAWRATPAGASSLRTVLAGPPRLARYDVAPDI